MDKNIFTQIVWELDSFVDYGKRLKKPLGREEGFQYDIMLKLKLSVERKLDEIVENVG